MYHKVHDLIINTVFHIASHHGYPVLARLLLFSTLNGFLSMVVHCANLYINARPRCTCSVFCALEGLMPDCGYTFHNTTYLQIAVYLGVLPTSSIPSDLKSYTVLSLFCLALCAYSLLLCVIDAMCVTCATSNRSQFIVSQVASVRLSTVG